jgi:hypothetical protein
MRKGNRLVLIALSMFGPLVAGMGLALFAGGQVSASDVIERIIQPPGMRAPKTFSETLILPSVSSAVGAPTTHPLVLPMVREQVSPQRQVAPGKRVTESLILPLVTQRNNSRQVTVSSRVLTETLILPMVIASDATRQAATQLKAVVTCAEAIQNGNFEAQTPGRPWTGVANLSFSRTAETFIASTRAHDGKQSARIGSPTRGNYWSEVIQTVELPKRTTSVTLTYWRFLDMPAASGARAADSFTVGIESEQGIQIVVPQMIDATTAGRGAWVKSTLTLPNAGAYAGKRIWVTFKGRTGARSPATLYIDDVQLSICAVR